METPIALCIYNRPDLTARIFARIAAQRPRRLFVIADGPRPDRQTDAALCAEARRIVTAIDWPCQLSTCFSPVNLGSGRRVASGLDWVFRTVPEAIILEDDCLPADGFFDFAEFMLMHYRGDERIGAVIGTNLAGQRPNPNDTYFFSRYFCPWGWATWSRVWRQYDFDMLNLDEVTRHGVFEHLFPDDGVRAYWQSKFRLMQRHGMDAWDYQFGYALLVSSRLVVVPAVNLVSNLGFNRADATHTTYDSPVAALPTGTLAHPFSHPGFIAPWRAAERALERYVVG